MSVKSAHHGEETRNPVAIVTIAAPLFLAPHVHAFIRFSSRMVLWLRWPTNAGARFGGSVGYATASLAAIDQLLRFIARVRAEVGEVRAPLLVLHSAADPTVPRANADAIMREAGSAVEESRLLPSWIHALTLEPHVETIEREIRAFIEEYGRQGPAHAGPTT